ncbi:MAG: tripartite tricarboxylate transporter substrate binding protein [Pseudomonadota bacterium]
MQRRQILRAMGLTPLLATPLQRAIAQEAYPAKPVTVIVAYVPGGSTDQRARQIGRFMAARFGQPVVVDNRPGAAGNIGTEMVARAKPDGYTLGMGNLAPLSVNPSLFTRNRFDPLKELTMIALIERGPLILLVNPASGYRSVADLVAAAKTKKGGLSYGSSGQGSAHHLSGELLKSMAGGQMTHIPYKGGAAATVDLMGGQLDFIFEPMYSALPSTQAGKLRALAITSEHRSPIAPEVPTMAEAGIPGFHMENWQGLIGPAGMPAGVVHKINAAVIAALADPAIRAQMLGQGNEIGGGTPERFAELVRSETARWRKVVATNAIVAQ